MTRAQARALPVFRRNLRQYRRGLIGWTTGIAAVLGLYLPLFPSMTGPDIANLLDSLPPKLVETFGYDQIATGPGYVQSTYFGLLGFLLMTITAVIWSSAAIAGSEESGRLELDLSHGIGRGQYVLEQAAATLLKLAWLGLFAGVMIWALNGPSQLQLTGTHLTGAVVALLGLSFLHASAGLLAGALTGRKSWATGAAAGLAAAGYVFQAVAKQSENLAWLRRLSPYSWAYHRPPLADGLDVTWTLVTWGLALLLVIGAIWALRVRDLHG